MWWESKEWTRAQPCKHDIMTTIGVIIADSSIQDQSHDEDNMFKKCTLDTYDL